MRIVHLTDAHLSSLTGTSMRTLRGKRRLGYLAWWRRRRHQFDAALLTPVTAAVRAEAPDLIVVTGDLVHLGLPQEMAEARRWLEQLRAINRTVLVPGNHDCYRADSLPEMHEQWADYLHLSAAGPDGFPSLLTCGEISVIGLSSAQPMPWWSAGGALGRSQLEKFSRILAATAGTFRCVLLHHPPLPGQAPRRKALSDAAALACALRQHGVELVLHGHLHCNQALVFAERTRVIVSAPAASTLRGNPASYRVFDIERDAGHWLVRAQLKTLRPDGVMTLAAHDLWRQTRS